MDHLKEFKTFVDEINKDNSRLYKISILEKYKDNESIKYFLNFIFNPFTTTGISDKKVSQETVKVENTFNTTRELLDYLKIHNTGTDEVLEKINAFRNTYVCFDSELYDLFDLIITKNLQIGVNAKTINKVIPGLISQFSVQLANKYFDKPEVLDGKEFSITTKIDGNRIIAMKDNGKVIFFTRAGKDYVGLIDLKTELESIKKDNFVFDGELVADIKGHSSDQFKATLKLARTKEKEKHGLIMKVFDILPVEEFKTQACSKVYKERRKDLEDLFSKSNFKYFSLLPILYTGTDKEMITKLLEEQTKAGEEGIMINANDGFYAYSRSNVLLKAKKFNDCELEVIDFEEGTNKYKHSLGALICRYKEKYQVKVGSGLDDDLRAEIWKNKDNYRGKLITVKYFEETTNDNGEESLRFPVFVCFRDPADL